MKQKLIPVLSVIPAAALCFVLAMASCTKKAANPVNDATKFEGTWICTSVCAAGTTTNISIGTGYDVNTAIAGGLNVGSATCAKAVSLTMVTTGNTFSIPAQTFTDNCSKSYSVSGSGSLDGTTLTFIEDVTLNGVKTSCTYTGHK